MSGYFNQKVFDSFLVDKRVVEFRETKVRLSHGRHSNLYINVRNLMDDLVTFDQFRWHVENFVCEKFLKPNYFIGVAEGMTKMGLIMTYIQARWSLKFNQAYKSNSKKYPLPIARGKIKKHGNEKDRYFLGNIEGKVVVLEDVLTTGSSAIELVENLKKNYAEVLCVVGIVDRLEKRKDGLSVAEKLSQLGVNYYSMTDVKTLLPLACEKLKPSEDLVKKINKYYKKYGSTEINI